MQATSTGWQHKVMPPWTLQARNIAR